MCARPVLAVTLLASLSLPACAGQVAPRAGRTPSPLSPAPGIAQVHGRAAVRLAQNDDGTARIDSLCPVAFSPHTLSRDPARLAAPALAPWLATLSDACPLPQADDGVDASVTPSALPAAGPSPLPAAGPSPLSP